MRWNIRTAILGAIAWFRARLNHWPNSPENKGNDGQPKETAADYSQYPTSNMLRAEWAALQTLIQEIHRSEEQHQHAERDLGAAQLRTAKGLNWVTAIGAGVSVLALLAIGASVIIAKQAADDGRRAVVAANRAWVGPVNVSLDKAPRIEGDILITTISVINFDKEPAIKGNLIIEPITLPISMPRGSSRCPRLVNM
jgi:hypothetical protein